MADLRLGFRAYPRGLGLAEDSAGLRKSKNRYGQLCGSELSLGLPLLL